MDCIDKKPKKKQMKNTNKPKYSNNQQKNQNKKIQNQKNQSQKRDTIDND